MYAWNDGAYLLHHGIKGQRWGVRRFQNPDGSLTAEGYERYYGGNNKQEAYRKLADYFENNYRSVSRGTGVKLSKKDQKIDRFEHSISKHFADKWLKEYGAIEVNELYKLGNQADKIIDALTRYDDYTITDYGQNDGYFLVENHKSSISKSERRRKGYDVDYKEYENATKKTSDYREKAVKAASMIDKLIQKNRGKKISTNLIMDAYDVDYDEAENIITMLYEVDADKYWDLVEHL